MVENSINNQYKKTVKNVFGKKGSDFWNEVLEKELKTDPRKANSAEKGLRKMEEEMGIVTSDMIRNTPLRKLVPEKYQKKLGKYSNEFASGGRTNTPKWVHYTEETLDHSLKNFSKTLDKRNVPENSDFIYIAPPAGPHLIGTIKRLAKMRNGMFFSPDLDPRYIRKVKKDGNMDAMKDYMKKVMVEVKDIMDVQLKGNNNWVVFSTPPIISKMMENEMIGEKSLYPQAIIMGGTPIEEEQLNYMEEVLPETKIMMLYGNTMAGGSIGEITEEGNILYPSPEPLTLYEVRDFENNHKKVEYGERGNLLIHRLTPEYFLPNFIESDEVTRIPAKGKYEHDWVADPGVAKQYKQDVEIGVY